MPTLGAITFVVALTQTKTYWIMYALYSCSLVLLLAAPSGEVGFEAEERGFQILLGVGLLVVGLHVLHAIAAWLAERDPQPELAPTWRPLATHERERSGSFECWAVPTGEVGGGVVGGLEER